MDTFRLGTAVVLTFSTLMLAACTTAETEQTAASSTASAGSLAGNVRRNLPRSGVLGDCPQTAERYIAASGHSAYASTDSNRFSGKGFICSASVNRKTTAEAEARALAGCEAGLKRWKYHYSGKCTIHASK